MTQHTCQKNPERANSVKVRLEATQQDLEDYIGYINSLPEKAAKKSFNDFLSEKTTNQAILSQAQDLNPGKDIIPVADFFYKESKYQRISGLDLSNLDLSGVNFACVVF